MNPAKKMEFDAVVANPPFSLRWEPSDTLAKNHLLRYTCYQNPLLRRVNSGFGNFSILATATF